MTTLINIAKRSRIGLLNASDHKKGEPRSPVLQQLEAGLVSCTAIVGSTCDAVTSAFSTAIISHLALLEFAGVGAIALLLFLLQIPALGHSRFKIGSGHLILLNSLKQQSIFHLKETIGDINNAWIVRDHEHCTGLFTG